MRTARGNRRMPCSQHQSSAVSSPSLSGGAMRRHFLMSTLKLAPCFNPLVIGGGNATDSRSCDFSGLPDSGVCRRAEEMHGFGHQKSVISALRNQANIVRFAPMIMNKNNCLCSVVDFRRSASARPRKTADFYPDFGPSRISENGRKRRSPARKNGPFWVFSWAK